MQSRQPLPRLWLMTDRRLGPALWDCIAALPSGAGVVLRHHGSDPALGERVAQSCRELGLTLGVAGDVGFARRLRAAMVHNPASDADGLLVSRSVHDSAQALGARGADLVFVSPVHASRSHPDGCPLGLGKALELARLARAPAIALGGMDEQRGAEAVAAGFHGWAAIDAWRRQARLRS